MFNLKVVLFLVRVDQIPTAGQDVGPERRQCRAGVDRGRRRRRSSRRKHCDPAAKRAVTGRWASS